MVRYLLKSKTFRLKWKSFRPNFRAVAQALPLGISSFLTQADIVLTSGISNMLYVKYGSDIPIAVMGIVMKVFAIVISIAIGPAIDAQPIIVSISRDLLFQFPAMLIMSLLWGIMGLFGQIP